jgi:hypothetical protein
MKHCMVTLPFPILKIKGKYCMAEKPSHVSRVSLSYPVEIGLKCSKASKCSNTVSFCNAVSFCNIPFCNVPLCNLPLGNVLLFNVLVCTVIRPYNIDPKPH